ncbi:MAG TPA: DUF402 domain-containing protein [Pyrinomonadaceae bacterium]
MATGEELSAAQAITVQTYKYDGSAHRRWDARVLRREDSLIVLDAVFAAEVRHPLLGTLARGTLSIEYYWLDRWYNVFRFLEPSRRLRNYYCNVNMPPAFDGRVLSYVDLDIDILVAPDLSYEIVDEDEFEVNARRFNYSPEIRRRAGLALRELVTLIESRQFPFEAGP